MRKIAVIAGIIIAGISCFGAGQSQGYHPQQRQLPNPIVITVNAAGPEKISTVQIDMAQEKILEDAKATLNESDVVIPQDIRKYCEAAGEKYNICPEFLMAMCWRESRCDTEAVNGNCIGVMQVSKVWHGKRMKKVGATDLSDAEDCINTAADYLSEIFSKTEDPAEALEIYNGDTKNLKNHTVSNYANDILEISAALERTDGK